MNHIEGYTRLHCYLECFFRQTDSASLGALLGGMSVLPSGETADPAYGHDWEQAVTRAAEERRGGDALVLRAAQLFLEEQLRTLNDQSITAALYGLYCSPPSPLWQNAETDGYSVTISLK